MKRELTAAEEHLVKYICRHYDDLDLIEIDETIGGRTYIFECSIYTQHALEYGGSDDYGNREKLYYISYASASIGEVLCFDPDGNPIESDLDILRMEEEISERLVNYGY